MPDRHDSERTCIVTRRVLPVEALIRFVAAPDGTVVPDLRRRLPGRGVWVTAAADHVRTAERKRLLARGFEGGAVVAPGLAERVDRLLESAALGALALARKAGTLIGGAIKVEAALHAGSVVALIDAREAAPDGIARLAAVSASRRRADALPAIRCFTGEQLDLAFGRTNVIHAALLAGPASDNVLVRVRHLLDYRGGEGDPGADGKINAPSQLNEISAGP